MVQILYYNIHIGRKCASAEREGIWDNHVQAAKDLLPKFFEADSMNYLRYTSWYFESIRQLHISHPPP